MNILFLHQNFPAQFKFLAPALAADSANRVVALTLRAGLPPVWQSVVIQPYTIQARPSPQQHPWLTDIETKVIRGQACFEAARQLKQAGFSPDVVIAHPGWGESLFIKQVWPQARLGIYCEFFYASQGADVGFDPEFPQVDPDVEACRLSLRNANHLLHLQQASLGLSPTQWQADSFPASFRPRISVIHDGIDTDALKPNANARLNLRTAFGALSLGPDDELVTFVNRNLEPYRGYHQFMRALPSLLRQRPSTRVLLVGGDEVSYGAAPPAGQSWKDRFIAEVRPQMSAEQWQRVHFLGKLPYEQFKAVLQCSRVHVYLSYPFVLSWSLLEAMSLGTAVVASDTAPVREVIEEGVTGRLASFFDPVALAQRIGELLDDAPQRQRLGQAARQRICDRYDLAKQCLPAQKQWVQRLADAAA